MPFKDNHILSMLRRLKRILGIGDGQVRDENASPLKTALQEKAQIEFTQQSRPEANLETALSQDRRGPSLEVSTTDVRANSQANAPADFLHVDPLFNAWLCDLPLGMDRTAMDRAALQTEERILADAQKIVLSRHSVGHLVRRMPGVVPQLMHHLRSENYSGAAIARKISNDVALVSAVVRMANTSQYNRSREITSIQQAILVIGQEGLRQLITGIAFQPIISSHSGSLFRTAAPRLWEQSEKCALANRFLALENGVDHFPVFLAGLIKNVGLNILMRIADGKLPEKQRIGTPEFCNALTGHALMLSARIVREWHLPEEVAQAIEEQRATDSRSTMSAMGMLVKRGDILSKLQILSRHMDRHPLPKHIPALPETVFGAQLDELEIRCMKDMQDFAAAAP